eukprot:CAMPEP_0206246802 /NCGR_PEP_ID=MMETSP0047_2-20121206/19464_1 /ASSEMBLY_ACC=CAM_ASM_000192 /TAXON_ID=195065 /ORGANISM="Chroomonas mesostigmatica_cf, Strain CCMP1168" /LENGTH=330 /DNA_ID=CAMNT_0053672271 /DNA_START=101 /DNA_END=1093 /DNA_ORIENTATION=-
MASVKSVGPLGFPYKTPDPFLFCVYHKDDYPAGDGKMQAPRMGNGADFDWSLPYRMYHGDRVPGFPQHPHRGFETLTTTSVGVVDHTDSMGNAGRYGEGDLQWMTAGGGIVHGEMFPLVHADKPNPLRLFQIWLNLPSKSKMVQPAFVMHWHEEIPVVTAPGARVVVHAGSLMGKTGLPPPPDSWAADPANDVAVWCLSLEPGASFTLPPAAGGDKSNRVLYWVEGGGLVDGKDIGKPAMITLKASLPSELKNGATPSYLLMLQGKPIGEPVAQHGPFVMNTQQEIQQCFSDYRRTQFGGWPWPDDAVVFPANKGRFAKLDGKEFYPPGK